MSWVISDSMVKLNQIIGSSFLSPAHGRVGARATILSISALPPSEEIAGGFQQAGKKEGGWGEGIFARLLSAEGGMGWERLSSLAPSREAKQNIFQFLLEEKGARANIEKKREMFCFARRVSAGGTLGGVSNHSSDFRSKKVRASFSNCDQVRH
ncbi:hypothetical protein KJ618_05015 [Patescibacteria group bacterium]|nr:hypothetical protein [Patescibacteria group bacterium]